MLYVIGCERSIINNVFLFPVEQLFVWEEVDNDLGQFVLS